MSLTKDIGRKPALIAEIILTAAVLVSAQELEIIDMPAGAVIDDAYLAVDETFDPTTSAVIEVGVDGNTDQLITSQNIFTGQATGGRTGAATGKGTRFTSPGAIIAKYTSGGGQATQGQLRVIVSYHLENQADFWQA